ncbi:DUF4238 domain-containing protein [Pseudomonas chlororaphis]|uniref:DUF4238 domain-containing protein n=1 Tax=Pseudomonas chlororaphis TaxID=587753 RepID=UPI000F56FF28|nr:DUF4238 domain-containing protein [Pseudomonas chlororaphis]AZD73468.1 hypothetical protein C4K16_3108 [Pseudomonas chlororaphis subsp. aurantiaca]
MAAQQSYRHHYVPQWYQKRFLIPGTSSFKVLDLKPEVYRDEAGRVRGVARSILDKGPDAWFFESELYTVRAFGIANNDIETMLFGVIDKSGKEAVEALVSEDWNKMHKTYSIFFEYMDAQRLRTPKGLAFLALVAQARTQYELMMQMQALRRMHCTMWGEGIIEIFSSEQTGVSFIFSDHPVTFFNRFVFPQDRRVPAGQDPLQQWMGTQTVYPLSRDKLLVITHLEWARKQGEHRAVKKRTHARLFDNPIVRFDNVRRGRQLSAKQIREVNLIIKLRAHRYIAGGSVDDLYPEKHLKTTLWSRLGLFLMPDSLHVAMEGENTFLKTIDGHYIFQDEFGRRPATRKEYEAKVLEAKAMEAHVKKLLDNYHKEEADRESEQGT